MQELIALYRKTLNGRIEALRLAADAMQLDAPRSLESISLIAHSLRGTGAIYGFPEISIAAAALEEADPSTLPNRFSHLIKILSRVAEGKDTLVQEILVIEDDIINALLIQGILTSANRIVHLAGSAEIAFGMLRERTFHLIMLDLVLPDMDGRAFLMKLKENPYTASLPVIVLSGKIGELTRLECLSLGASSFIHKPVQPEVLLEAFGIAFTKNLDSSNASFFTSDPGKNSEDSEPKMATENSILMAEDDEMIAKIIQHRLGREGYKIHWAKNGETALAACDKEKFSLAMLDVKMPMMDGFELLGRLRENPKTTKLPIIMLTSLGQEKDVTRGFDLGADDYLTKPFSPVELLARVKNLLRKK